MLGSVSDVRPEEPFRAIDPSHVRVLRAGHGANCSSIGSVVDTLFATAVIGSALFVAVAAALRTEPIKVVPTPREPPTSPPRPSSPSNP